MGIACGGLTQSVVVENGPIRTRSRNERATSAVSARRFPESHDGTHRSSKRRMNEESWAGMLSRRIDMFGQHSRYILFRKSCVAQPIGTTAAPPTQHPPIAGRVSTTMLLMISLKAWVLHTGELFCPCH